MLLYSVIPWTAEGEHLPLPFVSLSPIYVRKFDFSFLCPFHDNKIYVS